MTRKLYVGLGCLFSCLYLFYFLQGRPLWLDECLLALATLDTKYIDLFLPLTHQQVAPPLFLVIVKCIYLWGIMSVELRLRLFSFICAVGSVFIFIPFIKKFITDKKLILIGWFLFATSLWIPSYGQEFKQYMSDIFFGMVAYLWCDKVIQYKGVKLFLNGLLLGILSLLSQTTIFIVLAYIVGYTLCRLKIKHKLSVNMDIILKDLFFGLGWIIPVGLMIYLLYYKSPNLVHMNEGWQLLGGFIDFNISSIYQLFIKNINYLFLLSRLKLHFILFPIIVFQLVMIKKDGEINQQNLFLSILFFGILLASYLKLYPAAERTILWTFPFLIVEMLKPIEQFKKICIIHMITALFMFIICCNISLHLFNPKRVTITDPIEEYIPASIMELKKKPKIIPVYIKRFLKNPEAKNPPDHAAVYKFYKKIYHYQPTEEVIIDDGYHMMLGTAEQCQKLIQGQFKSGQKYALISMKQKVSPDCQKLFLDFKGKNEGNLYIWTQP